MMSLLESTAGRDRPVRPFLLTLFLVIFLSAIMALPTTGGAPAVRAAAPLHASLSAGSMPLPASGAPTPPSSDQAKALEAAQASLAQSWGVTPTLGPASCAGESGGCSLRLPAGSTPLTPVPGAAKRTNYPPLVTGAAVVYDANPADQFVLLFGGLLQTGTPSGQSWIYGGGSWANITPAAKKAQPSPRWDAMMTYDALDGYVVLFGGCTNTAVEGICARSAGDTWKFLTGAWAILVLPSPPNPPPNFPPTPSARWDGAMAYDSEMRAVVLFGGASGLIDNPPPPGSCQPLVPTMDSDTWRLTQSSGRSSWSQIGSGSPPPAGYGGRIADDPAASEMIYFGGTDLYRVDHTCAQPNMLATTLSGNDTTGTYTLSASGQWARLNSPVSPPPRRDALMGAGQSGQIFLWGGTNDTGGVFSDVWTIGGGAPLWSNMLGANVPPVPGTPLPRYDAGAAWDLYDGAFIVYGGRTATGSIIGDAWSFMPPLGWTLEASAPGFPAAPSTRYQEAMVFDDLLNGVVLFGGESCGATSCRFLGDTWLFTLGAWQPLSPPVAPSPRFGASMAYNPWTNALVLFGGCGSTCPLGDTWQFARAARGSAFVWTQLYPTIAPPARYYSTLTFVAMDPELLLFGGCEGSRGPCPAGDTWVYVTGNWRLVPPVAGSNPPARFGAGAAPFNRDPTASNPSSTSRKGGVIMFGGQGASGMLGDTWNFTSGAWSEIHAASSPPARVFATLVFDPVIGSLLLFGGCGWSQCPTFDPWTYSLGGPPRPSPPPAPPPPPWPWATASNLTTPNAPILSGPVYGSTGVWDPVDGPVGLVLFVGGRLPNGSTLLATDVFAGDEWMDLTRYV